MIPAREAREELRQIMKKKRRDMPPVDIITASSAIIDKIRRLPAISKARNILAYAAIAGEVNLDLAIGRWYTEGKRVLLPKTADKQSLQAKIFTGWEHTEVSTWGVREPLGAVFPPWQIEAVIVPGLVFDGQGYRLGYGRGYYDRFLAQLDPKAFLCGVCFAGQIVETVYPQSNDIPMHWVVTEKSELTINDNFF